MGIVTNDNFNVNAPKNIDDRYSVGGVTPYASVAAANAAIALSRRAIGLTVNIAGVEYWYQSGITDPDLVIKSAGAPTLVVPITRAALQALQTGGTLVPGTTYLVTNAQDALGGTVSMFASSNTTLEADGNWNFTANLGAQGRFQLLTGNAGSVNQITVTTPGGPVNLLSAPVAYAISRNNTAVNTVTAINANTGTTGVFAYVIQSYSGAGNLDQPIICLETTTGQTGFVYTLSVNVTTLTVGSVTSLTLGFNSATVNLLSSYDITNDRIVYAEDPNYKIKITNTIEQITTFGYNPVTFFRWNDPRLNNWTLTNSTVRDVQFRQTAVQRYFDVTLTNTTWRRFVTALGNQSRINMFAASFVQDINSIPGVNMGNINGSVNVNNLDCGQLAISLGSRGGIVCTTSTFGNSTSRAVVSLSTPVGQVALNGNNYTGSLTVQIINNQMAIGSQLLIQNNTISTRLIIINNIVQINMQISGNTGVSEIIIGSNTFDSPVLLLNNSFTGSNRVIWIQGCILTGANNLISIPYNCIDIQGCTIAGASSGYIVMQNSTGAIRLPQLTTFDFLDITRSHIEPEIVFGAINDLTLQDSILKLDNVLTFVGGVSITLIKSRVYNTDFSTAILVSLTETVLTECQFLNANSVTMYRSSCSKFRYDSALGPDSTIDLRNTSIENGNWTTSIFYNFTTNPIIAGSPFFITWLPMGFGKEIAYVMVGGGLVESVPGTILQLDSTAGIYFQQAVSTLISSLFVRDTTPDNAVVTSPTNGLLLNAVAGDIIGGDAAITVTGKYMQFI